MSAKSEEKTEVTVDDLRAVVERKASEDSVFAAKMRSDPRGALAEIGVSGLPASLKINVVEERPGELNVVVPAADNDRELDDSELDAASGGILPLLIPAAIVGGGFIAGIASKK